MDVASFVGRSLHEEVPADEEAQLVRTYHGALVDSGVEDYGLGAFQRDFGI